MAAVQSEEWGIADVSRWLEREGFDHLVNTFEKELIDGEALLTLDGEAHQPSTTTVTTATSPIATTTATTAATQ